MTNKAKTLLLSLLLFSAPAAAMDETADTARVVDLDEVIIVAQPKEQSHLRLQPVSSSVFGDGDLLRLHATDLSQLSQHVPSFDMPSYGSRLTSSVYVRGIGSRINAPAVGIYFDGVPLMSKSAFNSHFYMLDRVDVLRGPQGTLYGQNTEGGLVRIYSKNPMQYQGTDLLLGGGNGFTRRAELAHYHHPTEQLAFSVAAFYNGQDGFFDNANLGKRNDLLNEAGGRLRLIWAPTERFTADATADYQFTDQRGFPYGAYDPASGDVADPSTTFMSTYRRNMLNTGLTLSYRMPSLLLSSTTSFQHLYDHMDMDQDYVPADRMALHQHQRQNAWTEELTLRSHGESRWQHATGIFGSRQSLHTDAPVTFGPDMNNMLAQMILGFLPASHQSMFSTWEIPSFGVAETFSTPQTNLAVFHESTLRITDRLSATAGLRLDYVRTKVSYDAEGQLSLHYVAQMGPRTIEATNTLTDSIIGSAKKNSTQLLPKFGLTWLTDNKGSNVYLQVSKGYRAGGYNIQMFSDIMQTELQAGGAKLQRGDYNIHEREHTAQTFDNVNKTIEYDPETSWNYELGAHLNLFDGRLKADLSTFYMQIRNLQLAVMAGNYGFGRMMVNAGRSSSCGLEMALRGSALDGHLSWAAAYSFTRSTFREYKDSVSVGGQRLEADYKDKHVPYVPSHTFSVSADYRFDMADGSLVKSLTLGANVAGRGRTYWNEANTAWQNLYATLGAHATLDMGAVSLDLWGRNLTDTDYATFAMPYSSGFIAQRANPVQCGIDLRVHL